MKLNRPTLLALLSLPLLTIACSSTEGPAQGTGGQGSGGGNGPPPASGGQLGSGGMLGGGGANGVGGAPSSGGLSANAGGLTGIGGMGTGGLASGGIQGGGGSDGAGGEVGTGGSATEVMLMEPIDRGSTYVLEFGNTFFEVQPSLGGRITQFSQGSAGANVLAGTGDNTGSTYWTSPQVEWGWPPPSAVNDDAYTAALEGSTIVLTSGSSPLGSTTITVEKRFTANLEVEAIDISYTATNTGTEAVSLAGWEISRVAPDGISFFPVGPGGINASVDNNELITETIDGVVWFDEGADAYKGNTENSGNNKSYGDGVDGWIAHATESNELFIKTFVDIPETSTAPGHGDIELYASNDGLYVEVENQGEYKTLAGGESVSYSVRWAIRSLGADVPAAVGAPLEAAARSLAAEIGQP